MTVITNVITAAALTAALTAVRNNIPDVSNLFKNVGYIEKIKYIEKKYFTTSDCNKFTNDVLDAKIKNKKILNEFGISGFISNTDLD